MDKILKDQYESDNTSCEDSDKISDSSDESNSSDESSTSDSSENERDKKKPEDERKKQMRKKYANSRRSEFFFQKRKKRTAAINHLRNSKDGLINKFDTNDLKKIANNNAYHSPKIFESDEEATNLSSLRKLTCHYMLLNGLDQDTTGH
ncbi:hypothetical protein C1645_745789 [Glomus cerebriforme]|uniref:Uncharacterized protein n=1 Tax=Glomus cerebriforme TaxID=658196 RepID=A0A397S120_9GLOM|nr:hypothetical protein C1645_745789 [Glomus cerebriforme]